MLSVSEGPVFLDYLENIKRFHLASVFSLNDNRQTDGRTDILNTELFEAFQFRVVHYITSHKIAISLI